jgi:ABC-type multidrug transport system ATPase subunit
MPSPQAMQASVIEARDVVVGQSGLPPFSLDLGPGDIVGVLSPEGASQTSLLRALAGLEDPRSGDVRVRADASRVAFVGQGRVVAS